MNQISRGRQSTVWICSGFAAIALAVFAPGADAIPSMARQTGQPCASCHTVWPELTSFGRLFKLRGFSLSVPQPESSVPLFGNQLPISAVVQASATWTANTDTPGAEPEQFPKDGKAVVQTGGFYYGGKIAGNAGALVQYSYNGVEKVWETEMFDLRYGDGLDFSGKELIYGFTLSNGPTVTDIYNSTPVWSFPHVEAVATMPNARPLLDMTLMGQVGGPGVYALWDGLLYGEFALYRTTKSGALRPLGWGSEHEDVVKGYAPYWRIAVQRELSPHGFSVGAYGMSTKLYADANVPELGTNRFSDVAVDGQYQYIDGDHVLSAHGTWIYEKQEWNASFPLGMSSSESTKLRTARADMHYWYQRKLGGGVQFFRTWGDANALRYDMGEPVMGSINGKPDNAGWMAELNYLPWQNVKFALRYTAYTKFNGAKSNYDGFGRNASDNNSTYLLGWFMW